MTYFNTPTPGNVILTFLLTFFGFNYNLPGQGLAGNYTIGGTTADYPTFSAAIAALDSFGVDGPVIFNVRIGVYEESDTIREIARTSAINTVTFQSETEDSSDVVLQCHSGYTGNWNLRIYRSSHLIFRKIGFRQMFDAGRYNVLLIGGHDITFENCLFEGSNMVFDGILLGGSVDSGLTVNGCNFRLARHAISLKGKDHPSKYLRLQDNQIHTQNTGFLLMNMDSLVVRGNHFENICGGLYCGLLTHVVNNIRISGNSFKIMSHHSYTRAIDIDNVFENNRSGNWVSNNVVRMDVRAGNHTHALKMGNASGLVIAHNTIRYDSPNPNHSAVRFMPEANGIDSCYFYNNVVANTGMGSAYSFNGNMGAGLHNDYNLWYSAGGYITPGETDLATVWARDSSNLHSFFVPPLFRGKDDHIADASEVDSNAFPFTQINMDILGNKRNRTVPDIGAFEHLHLPTLLLPADTSGCGSITLLARGDATRYQWSTGGSSDSISVNSSGYYWVSAINGDGRVTDSVRVIIGQPRQFTVVASLDSIEPGQCINLSLLMTGDTNYTAVWSDSTGLIGNAHSMVVCPLNLPATFKVEVIDSNGCSRMDSITIFPKLLVSPIYKVVGPVGPSNNSPTHIVANPRQKTGTDSSIAEAENSTIAPRVFPNPASQKIFIEWTATDILQAYLSDLAGNIISAQAQPTSQAGIFELSLEQVASGSYILTVFSSSETHQFKLVKIEE